MEFTKEQLKEGQAKADYSARHFKTEQAFRERLTENFVYCAGLPHCPDQMLRGDNKALLGSNVKRWLKTLAEEGVIEFVAGPTGKLNYIVAKVG